MTSSQKAVTLNCLISNAMIGLIIAVVFGKIIIGNPLPVLPILIIVAIFGYFGALLANRLGYEVEDLRYTKQGSLLGFAAGVILGVIARYAGFIPLH